MTARNRVVREPYATWCGRTPVEIIHGLLPDFSRKTLLISLLSGSPTGDRFGTFGDEGRTGIDEAGVKLEELGARFHLFNGILRRHDAAGGDDRKSTLNVIGDEADDFSGAFAERSAGKAARFRAVGHA